MRTGETLLLLSALIGVERITSPRSIYRAPCGSVTYLEQLSDLNKFAHPDFLKNERLN
jgi:hypothetical protein